jgi:plasmid stabilization system protein ParE
VAQVVYSRNAVANLERAFDFLAKNDPEVAVAAAKAIQSAVDALVQHPLIGRPVERRLRELVISVGRTGYVALYRFVPARDEVRILALRHQRELDYST